MEEKSDENKRVNKLRIILPTAFWLVFYITVISPLIILMRNYYDFGYGVIEVLFFSLKYFFVALLILIAPMLFIKPRMLDKYTSVLAFLLLVSVIFSEVLYGNYGVFDGKGIVIDNYSLLSVVQILFSIIFLFAIFFFKIRKNMVLISISILGINFLLAFSNFILDNFPLHKEPYRPASSFYSLSKDKPNYLYILMDEVYGGSAQEILSTRTELANKFTGFTNYTNTSGVYPTTLLSIPAILNGSIYQEGENLEDFYQDSFDKSLLFKTLIDENFDYKVHTHSAACKVLAENVCSQYNSMGESSLSLSHQYNKLLNFSIFKLVPDILKANVYNNDNWLISQMRDKTVKEFDYFVKNLNSNNNSSTFRMFHNILTHSPIKYNDACDLMKKNLSATYENYIGQDICGYIQLSRITDKLKQLDIYDNTFIIVSSDHGRGMVPKRFEKAFLAKQNLSSKEYGYAHAMLMIKPLNASGKLKQSHEPKSLIDISHQFLSNITNVDFKSLPTRNYYHYILGDWSDKKTFPPFIGAYIINKDIQNPNDWQLKKGFIRNSAKTRITEKFSCNDTLMFSSKMQKAQKIDRQAANKIYFAEGLSDHEKFGRWSYHEKVLVHFKAEKLCIDSKLAIKLRAFLVKNKHQTQQAIVSLNNNVIGKIRISVGDKNPNEFIFDIPSQIILKNELNTLSFDIDTAVSPKTIGLNSDSRMLGFLFESISFK
ncbi:sulfatase-like hydrolase/transferase [Methylophilaceae bacterium]|nr:sulfatase-like hydrolase/transferase [Methylophilaceae bacterium]